MKTYKNNDSIECQAFEYGVDEESKEYVKLCYPDYENKIRKVPGDMLGRPKNAFDGVQTESGWKQVQKGDFIVKQEDKVSIVSGDFFRSNFVEIKSEN